MSTTIWAAIQAQLGNDVILTSLLAPTASNPAGSVWYSRAPAHTVMPYVEFFSPDQTGNLQLTGPATTGKPYVETLSVQFNIFTLADPAGNNAIAKRIAQLLDPPASNLVAPSDATVLVQMRTSPLDWLILEEQAGITADDVWHGILTYQIKLQRTW